MILSRFFGQSKPIVFLILASYLSIHFWVNTLQTSAQVKFTDAGKYILFLLIFLGINFIVKRNKINQQHTYAAFSMLILSTFFPAFYLNLHYLIPAFIVVLGIRRIISLKTQIDTKKKIFDASLWFFIASLFQPYLLFLLLLVFFGVLQYTLYNPRNLFIPIIAWVCGGLFYTAFQLWETDKWVFFYETYTQFGWNNFGAIWEKNKLILILLIPFLVWVLLGITKVISKAQLALKTSLVMLIFAFVIIFFGWMFSNQIEAAGLAISFIPLSMLAGASLEVKMKPIIKEILIALLIIASLITLFMPI